MLAMQQDIRTNLERVRERIARAAERAGRRAEDVLLIGVSKTVDVGRIRTALAAGLSALGENRVQEARDKIAELGRPVAWHLVGHLQTNKVREVLELFDVVHSVDRIDLARELRSDVLLIGVSKTVDVGRIRTALAAGLSALGENRVQEARDKIAELGRPVAWHLVGHLQTNKVREVLELFDVVHSVDRIDLAREL